MKKEEFKVSVIIPVYNAAKYIERAVESTVAEREIREVILIDDGYPDDAIIKCKQLAAKYKQVQVFQHPNGENLGAGASRNLGIKMATSEYIAFLDADDYYLPGRFNKTAGIFLEEPSVDGIYEPVGTDYANEAARKDFCKWRGVPAEESSGYVTYPTKPLSGKKFFYSLLRGDNGFPHIDGITIRRSLFDKAGIFNADLRLHQDTEWWIRASYKGTFVSGGHSEVVAIRFAHSENRITGRSHQSFYALNKSIYDWANSDRIDPEAARLILKNYIISKWWNNFGDSLIVKMLWRISYCKALLTNSRYWSG